MPRKRDIPKKKILPDPIYKSTNVTRLTNMIMQDGKKRTAEKIVYDALSLSSKKTKEEPLIALDKALQNVGPSVEVKSRRVGGSNYQVPIEVNSKRKISLAMKWIIEAASKRNEKSMAVKLAQEILAAAKEEGSAVKKRVDTHKMAEANKAFSHFRF